MTLLYLSLAVAFIAGLVVIALRILSIQTVRWERARLEASDGPHFEKTEQLFDRAQKRRFIWWTAVCGYFIAVGLTVWSGAPAILWVFLLPLALPLIFFVLHRLGAAEPLPDGVQTPPVFLAVRKVSLIIIALVLVAVVLSHGIPYGFRAWPSLERSADQTGLSEFFKDAANDWIMILASLGVISLMIFGCIKRITIMQWVWPGGMPVYPPNPGGTYNPPIEAVRGGAAAREPRLGFWSSFGPFSGMLFAIGVTALVFLLAYYAWIGANPLGRLEDWMRGQGMLLQKATYEEMQRKSEDWKRGRQPSVSPPTDNYNQAPAPTYPERQTNVVTGLPASQWTVLTRPYLEDLAQNGAGLFANFLRDTLRGPGYNIALSSAHIPPGQWWSVLRPDAQTRATLKTFVSQAEGASGRFFVIDCMTGAEVEIRGSISANVGCSPLKVRAENTAVDLFFLNR